VESSVTSGKVTFPLVREVTVKTLSVLQKQAICELSFPLVRTFFPTGGEKYGFLSSSIQIFPGFSSIFFMKKRDELDGALALY
jgi:hypothetical protein